MKKFFAYLIILSFTPLFMSNSAFASCYTKSEAEAEQGIRIHSELMVIGLNCQHMGPGGKDNLYLKYRSWTKKHEAVFSGYEDTLMFHFSRSGIKNPEGELNELRTNFANKISLEAAKMRPDIFCNHYGERIKRADKLSTRQIKDWASTFYASHPVSKPICH